MKFGMMLHLIDFNKTVQMIAPGLKLAPPKGPQVYIGQCKMLFNYLNDF